MHFVSNSWSRRVLACLDKEEGTSTGTTSRVSPQLDLDSRTLLIRTWQISQSRSPPPAGTFLFGALLRFGGVISTESILPSISGALIRQSGESLVGNRFCENSSRDITSPGSVSFSLPAGQPTIETESINLQNATTST